MLVRECARECVRVGECAGESERVCASESVCE